MGIVKCFWRIVNILAKKYVGYVEWGRAKHASRCVLAETATLIFIVYTTTYTARFSRIYSSDLACVLLGKGV